MLLRTSLFECTQALLRINAPTLKLKCRHVHVICQRGNVLSRFKPIFTKRSNIFVTASFRNASDAASTTPPPAEFDPLNYIPDIPTPIPEESIMGKIIECHANGEETFASLGLGGYHPSGLVQSCLEWLHISCDLPWWASIIIGTVCIRLLMFPLVIKSQRNSLKLAIIHQTLQDMHSKINEAQLNHDYAAVALYRSKLQDVITDNNYNPAKSFVPLIFQFPIFMSVYLALKGLVTVPIESMKEGGLLWFVDLTVTDPYHALPLIMSGTLFLTLKLGTDGISTQSGIGVGKYVILAMPVVTAIFTFNFPAAILFYWLSSNVIALAQVKLLRIPKVATFLRLPLPERKPQVTFKVKAIKTEIIEWKKTLSKMKYSRQFRFEEAKDERQFKEAGQGPIPRTFTYDPTKQSSASAKK